MPSCSAPSRTQAHGLPQAHPPRNTLPCARTFVGVSGRPHPAVPPPRLRRRPGVHVRSAAGAAAVAAAAGARAMHLRARKTDDGWVGSTSPPLVPSTSQTKRPLFPSCATAPAAAQRWPPVAPPSHRKRQFILLTADSPGLSRVGLLRQAILQHPGSNCVVVLLSDRPRAAPLMPHSLASLPSNLLPAAPSCSSSLTVAGLRLRRASDNAGGADAGRSPSVPPGSRGSPSPSGKAPAAGE